MRVLPRTLALCMVIAVAACSSSSSSGSSGNNNQSKAASAGPLSVTVQGPIQTFNPWQAPSGGNGNIITFDAVYDTLLRQQTNGAVVPGIATSWKVVDTHTITMTLRSGVKFDDGTPVDAHAVKANFDYAQSTSNPGQCNPYLDGVTTDVNSATTLTLHLTTPNPDLLKEIAMCGGFLVNPKALQAPDSLRTAPNGSGPYTYQPSQTVPNSKWVYEKRPRYWDSGLFPFSSLTVNFINNATAADNAARTGQVDFIQSVLPTDTSSGLKLYFTEPNQLRGLAIGDPQGALLKPFGSQLVRQAMNYAVDREAILKGLYEGKGQISGCSCPYNQYSPGWSKSLNSIYSYDPAKAKQLLAQAGYPDGFSFQAMDSPLDPNAALLQAIAGYLGKVGINMQVSLNNTTFIPTMLQGKTPAFFENWTITGFPYYNIAQVAGPKAFWNPRQVADPLLTHDLSDITAATGSAQVSSYAKAARDFAEAAWYVAPVLVSNTSAYNSSRLKFSMTVGAPAPYLYNFQPA